MPALTPQIVERLLPVVCDDELVGHVRQLQRLDRQLDVARIVLKARRPVLSPRPILLVEDDPKDAELIREALRAAGFPNSIVVYKDGTSAVTLLTGLDRNEPCVVIVDLKLPGPSGFDVIETMKADPALQVSADAHHPPH